MGDATNVQAVQRLIDRHSVHAVINGYNIGSGGAIQDVIADSGIIYVHYDTTIGHNNVVKSDPDKYFGSFMGDPPEYWYGPGFLKFVQQLEEAGSYKRANNKMAVILSAGVYAANIANAIKEQAATYGWEISLFETVNVPISEWGPTLAKIRQDPPAVIAVTQLPPGRPRTVHGAVRAQSDEQPDLHAVWSLHSGLPRDRQGSLEWRALRHRRRRPAGRDRHRLRDALQGEIRPQCRPQQRRAAYDGCYVWATAAALAGGTGEPAMTRRTVKWPTACAL